MSEPTKPYAQRHDLTGYGTTVTQPVPEPSTRRPTLEPATQRQSTGASMDDDKPDVTPPGVVRRTATAVGALARGNWPSDEAAANLGMMRWAFWGIFGVLALNALADLVGWDPRPVQHVYVEKCEDVTTRLDQLRGVKP